MKLLLLFVLLAIGTVIAEPKLLRTPGGKLVHPSCLHRVPNGASIVESDDGTSLHLQDGSVKRIPACKEKIVAPTFADGWQTWASYKTSASSFDSFIGNFTVPDAPKGYTGQLLYAFTGLQNFNWIPGPNAPPAPAGFDIIQPVLQYGFSPAGGGQYWGVASWYVTLDDSYLVTDVKKVDANDSIFGNMSKTGKQSWKIVSEIVSTGESVAVDVTRPRLASQPWAYCTLEVYDDSNDCSNYPANPMVFSELSLTVNGSPVTPKWATHVTTQPICKEHTVVNNSTSVTIFFN